MSRASQQAGRQSIPTSGRGTRDRYSGPKFCSLMEKQACIQCGKLFYRFWNGILLSAGESFAVVLNYSAMKIVNHA